MYTEKAVHRLTKMPQSGNPAAAPGVKRAVTLPMAMRFQIEASPKSLSEMVREAWTEYCQLSGRGLRPFPPPMNPRRLNVHGRYRTTVYLDLAVDASIKQVEVQFPAFDLSLWVEQALQWKYGIRPTTGFVQPGGSPGLF